MTEKHDSLNDIAIIGMDARVPGANDVEQFWELLRTGTESTRFGGDPHPLGPGMSYVKAAPVLEGVELFDAGLFAVNPREAATMDPQLRLFLECAWTALEDAGCDPKQFPGRIGVYGGAQPSSYMAMNLARNAELMGSGGGGPSTLVLLNDRDALTTLVSYKLDLTGPAVTVQTFCSTSLVAVHLACQSLLNGESDVALAGGVTINLAIKNGYVYLEGGMVSPDGHTRSFDAQANGTVFGNGVGIVVLKRLNDALADGDRVHAVLRGTAINNDGSQKGGYTAPSVIGQSKAIAEAMAIAQVNPETIGYVEAHGTATSIGDPIEIEALTRAFRGGTDKRGFCAIGSVKTNFGHLDRAAGVISLIKVVLALKHAQIPPSLHFENPNPRIDFENSPFRVNAQLRDWTRNGTPRRAGVSALGVGGTNAHAIVEEAPVRPPSDPSRPHQLLVVSGRTSSALQQATERLAAHLESHPDLNLADVAFTLQTGRRRFDQRRAIVCGSVAEAVGLLKSPVGPKVSTAHAQATARPVVFMFSGQGAQYVNMTRGLYEQEPVYRRHLDECFTRVRPLLGLDLKELLFADADRDPSAPARLNQTAITQPAVFAVEYALARLWMSWGIKPQAMIGHSVGEYVAAHLAGVFSLDDALALVVERGRLMQSMEPGSMLAVGLPSAEMPALPPGLSLAAINAPSLCVVSGPTGAIGALQEQLQQRDVSCTPLHTSHAFHSSMMDPMLGAFAERLRRIKAAAPSIPYISNLTGTWISAEQATDPAYWTAHLRETVRFSDGVATLWEEPERILLEVGPGTTLTGLARQHARPGGDQVAIPSGRHPRDVQPDGAVLLGALGRLWTAGADVRWPEFYGKEHRHRVSLPSYPFEREKYWIEPTPQRDAKPRVTGKNPDLAGWFYAPGWQSTLPSQPFDAAAAEPGAWLVFAEPSSWGRQLTAQLRAAGREVIVVEPGSAFGGSPADGYTIDPPSLDTYEALISDLEICGKEISRIVHAWAVEPGASGRLTPETFSHAQHTRFYSLLNLARALGASKRERVVQIKVVCAGAFEVLKGEPLRPDNAPVIALSKVLPQEHEGIVCSTIDVDAPDAAAWNDPDAFEHLVAELGTDGSGAAVAYRHGQRWIQTFNPIRLPAPAPESVRLRDRGVYVIVGGLGGVGFALATYLAKAVRARLVLTGRSMLPPRGSWKVWLDSRGPGDPASLKIRRVRKLEELGAEVMVASADAADAAAMEEAMQQAERQFGPIDGVIYAAGIVGGDTFRMIQSLERDACEQQFHPKVSGLLALDRVLAARPVDFCLLTSSLSSVLGGLGYGAYAAANAFMDAFTRYRNQRSGANWISVNWDEWRLSESTTPEEGARGLAQFALTPPEGGEAFGRILSLRGVGEVVVSTGDLQARINQWIKLEGLRESATPAADRKPTNTRYPRPNLQNAYVAPGTPSEQKIAEVWQDLLGIEQVGIHDNFFELGGHSMLGIQLVTRIKVQFKANISIATLFEGPTVESLAGIIAQRESGEPEAFDHSRDRGQRRKERSRERSREADVAAGAVAGAGGVAIDGGVDLR